MSFPRYPKYKDSGVEWLGEVPEHWDIRRLKFLCDIQTGDKDTENAVEDGTFPFFVRSQTVERINSCSFDCEAILTAGDGAGVGKVFHYHKGPFDFHQRVYMLNKFRDVSGPFLFHFLRENFYKVALEGGAKSTVDSLRRPLFTNFPIAIPPDDEQQFVVGLIAAESQKIDELVAEQRRLIELLKEKRQAVISHAVTKGLNPNVPMKPSGIEWLGEVPEHWKVGKCGFYLNILSGFAFPSAGFTEDETAIKLLRGINVGISRLRWTETVYWRRESNDGLDIFEMQAGDLVLSMDRPLISEGMRAAMVQPSDLPCLLLQRVASLKTGSLLNAHYLLGLLSSEMFVAHFSPDTTGVSVPHISPEQINNFVIPVPPLTEQEAIVAFVSSQAVKLDALTAEAERAIDLLQERRTALISAAVTGKIDVRGWVNAEGA